jgi:hypothetical protein
MKKSIKTLFLSAAALAALVSCGEQTSSSVEGVTSSSAPVVETSGTGNSETGSSSSSEAKASSSQKTDEDTYYEPDELIAALSDYQVTLRSTSMTLDIYSENAIDIDTGSASYGYLFLDDTHSVWQYELNDNDEVELTDCMFGHVEDSLSLKDFLTFYSALDTLLEDETGDNWTAAKKSHTYTTTDSSTISAILTLGGYYASSSSYTTYSADKITMTSKKDGTVQFSGTVTATSYYSGSSSASFYLVMSNIGNNENDAVSNFLADPEIPTVTDWKAELKTTMADVSGSVLPWSDKLTAYSTYYTEDGTYTYQDFRSGDITSDYGALLLQKGFTKVEDTSSSSSSSTSSATSVSYTKVKKAGTDISGEVDYIVTLTYYSKALLATNSQDAYYQDGVFQIYGYTYETPLTFDNITSINNFLSKKYTKTDGSAFFPKLDFTPSTVSFVDSTESMNTYLAYYGAYLGTSITCTGCYYITGSFATGEEALMNLTAWCSSLVSTSGLTAYKGTELSATEHSAVYQVGTMLQSGYYEVDVKLGEVDDGSSSGVLSTSTSDDDTSSSSSETEVAALDGSFSIMILSM